jgi:hypothetical protein
MLCLARLMCIMLRDSVMDDNVSLILTSMYL